MANDEENKVGEIEVYYHALYHHVAHWAAYVATMVLLVTVGLLVSLTPITSGSGLGQRKFGAGAAVVCGLIAAIYFIKGMDTYGGILNTECLPTSYLTKVLTGTTRLR